MSPVCGGRVGSSVLSCGPGSVERPVGVHDERGDVAGYFTPTSLSQAPKRLIIGTTLGERYGAQYSQEEPPG